MDKKIAVKIAEAKVRVAQRKLAEAKKALKESEKPLNEDVNNYTFKDLFGKTFDDVLKDACEKIAKIPEEFETYGWETVSEVLENGSDPDLIQEMDDNAGAEVEHIVASTVCALLDKDLDLEKFNDLRTKLGLEPIEEKEESDEE